MKYTPKLTVRPDMADAVIRIFSCSGALLLIGVSLYPTFGLLNSCLSCLLPFLLWTGCMILRCRNTRIFVFDWGMVFCDIRGTMTKVCYKDLSAVSLSSRRYFITARFYAGGNYVGSCSSRDENYDLFMKELSIHVPEKLDWPGTFY